MQLLIRLLFVTRITSYNVCYTKLLRTRVDTRSTNPDIQVDCYKDGKDMYLILNNLDAKETSINLNMHGNFGAVSKVNIKHLYLSGVSDIKLDNNDFSTMPQSVKLAANGTMIIKCTVATATAISETLTEKKYYAESLSGGVAPHRVAISAAGNTIKVNNVTVPSGTSEAVLKITGSFYDGHEGITSLKVNGTSVAIPTNWRGVSQNRSRYFGTLEIPFNGALLQANNTFTVVVKHVGELSCASLVVSEFTAAPGRTNVSSGVAVTGISLEPATVNVQMQRTLGLVATVAPANASDKTVTWLSSDVSIATVGATRNNFVQHTLYEVIRAYSEAHEQAYWVYYYLKPDYIHGPAQRSDRFKPDPKVKTGSATLGDYKGSGYDRGHLCPAAAMRIDQTAMDETFYFSNMSPQKHVFNGGKWKELEA